MSIINKSSLHHTYLVLIIMCFFVVNPVYAEMNINDAVNMAGKQRMLTQRILQNYAMSGMKIVFGDPAKDLQQNITLFDDALKNLKALQVNAEVNQSLKENEQLWSSIKKVVQATAEKENVTQLQTDLDALLASCHKTTGLIAKASGSGASEIVNISGRQRMLSQRLAALYMLQVWGMDDPEFKNKLLKTMDEFSKAQDTLEQSKVNTAEINAGLKKVRKLFKWFEVMGRSTSGKYVPAIISKSSDKILKEMNTITSLYTKAI